MPRARQPTKARTSRAPTGSTAPSTLGATSATTSSSSPSTQPPAKPKRQRQKFCKCPICRALDPDGKGQKRAYNTWVTHNTRPPCQNPTSNPNFQANPSGMEVNQSRNSRDSVLNQRDDMDMEIDNYEGPSSNPLDYESGPEEGSASSDTAPEPSTDGESEEEEVINPPGAPHGPPRNGEDEIEADEIEEDNMDAMIKLMRELMEESERSIGANGTRNLGEEQILEARHDKTLLAHRSTLIEAYRITAFFRDAKLTDSQKEIFKRYFPELLEAEPGVYRTAIANATGYRCEWYDKCKKGDYMFYKSREEEPNCPRCNEIRINPNNGKPWSQIPYFPIAARLAALLSNPKYFALLSHRANHTSTDGTYSDTFDGENYKRLRAESVVVDGDDLGFKYFSCIYDIALSLSGDGIGVQKRMRERQDGTKKGSINPMVLINKSLPPEIRNQLQYILPVIFFDGHPACIHSFLVPLIEELKLIARNGIRAINPESTPENGIARYITFRVYLLDIFGDLPFKAQMSGFVGHNGKLPCTYCKISGIKAEDNAKNGGHYYFPLDPPLNSATTDETLRPSVDPYNLPSRTHDSVLADIQYIKAARNRTEAKNRRRDTGVKELPIVATVPGFRIPNSVAFEAMHAFTQNTTKNLIKLYSGQFFKKPVDGEDWRISDDDLKEMGIDLAGSRALIPSAYGIAPHDVWSKGAYLISEDYMLFLTLYGPIILQHKLPGKYYRHFVEYGRLVGIATDTQITEEELVGLEVDMVEWVKDAEELFYQSDIDKIHFCTATLHDNLHAAEKIRQQGPLCTTWAYPMERYCGMIKDLVNHQRCPLKNIALQVERDEQLKLLDLYQDISSMFKPKFSTSAFHIPDVFQASIQAQVRVKAPVTTLRKREKELVLEALCDMYALNSEEAEIALGVEVILWQHVKLGADRKGNGDVLEVYSARGPPSGNNDNRSKSFCRLKSDNLFPRRDRREIVFATLDSIPQVNFAGNHHLFAILTLTNNLESAKDTNPNLWRYPAGSSGIGKKIIVPIDDIECVVGSIGVRHGGQMRYYVVDRTLTISQLKLDKHLRMYQ